MILTVSVCYKISNLPISTSNLTSVFVYTMYRNFVLATGAIDQTALETLLAVDVEDGQNAALVQITVLDDLVNGEVLAKLRGGQKFGLRFDDLGGQTADVVPSLALTSHGSLYIIRIKIFNENFQFR